MSAKYKRIKQADLALPAPLRWLTRAFSSITLSVFLLTFVALYGALGSVPLYFMAIGAAWVVIGVAAAGLMVLACRRLPGAAAAAAVLASVAGATVLCVVAARVVDALPIFGPENHATIIYRLRAFEMNEPEFFAWWPLRLVLLLFVANMVWATIRRIEFSVPRIGVLTVHTGIVTMALGSVFYGMTKVEGDLFITRADLPGAEPVSVFYDRNDPALYVGLAGGTGERTPRHQISLDALPRYNDYADGELDLRLHESPGFADRFGSDLQITVPAFFAYAEFQRVWQPVPVDATDAFRAAAGPMLTLQPGDADGPGTGEPLHFAAARPADRVSETPSYAVEYLHNPTPERLADLQVEAPFDHALVVEIPGQNYREVFGIEAGLTFPVGDTGYILTVDDLGDYGIPFITEGYRGARDTQATVTIQRPAPLKSGRRITLYRYPERSQEFTGDQRGDPAPDIRLTYLDNTKPQIRLITRSDADGDPNNPELSVLLRLPGFAPAFGPLTGGKVPLAIRSETPGAPAPWLHVTDFMPHAVPARRPVSVPRVQRDPKLEGTYQKALLPVRVRLGDYQQTVVLRQMPYLEQPGGEMRPETVSIPGYGEIELAFSRQRFGLPFAVAMTDFEMVPYAGSDIPRDFSSDLLVYPVDDQGRPDGLPERVRPHLNHPVIQRTADAPFNLRRIKLSQAGWDPGDPQTPPAVKAERNAQGRFVNQQRFTILGVGNNVGIRVIAAGAVLIALGIPWAFYLKPYLIRRGVARRNARAAAARTSPHLTPPASAALADRGASERHADDPAREPAAMQ